MPSVLTEGAFGLLPLLCHFPAQTSEQAGTLVKLIALLAKYSDARQCLLACEHLLQRLHEECGEVHADRLEVAARLCRVLLAVGIGRRIPFAIIAVSMTGSSSLCLTHCDEDRQSYLADHRADHGHHIGFDHARHVRGRLPLDIASREYLRPDHGSSYSCSTRLCDRFSAIDAGKCRQRLMASELST